MELIDLLRPIIESLAGMNGKVAQILLTVVSVVGIARIFFKPIMSAADQIVKNTPGDSDDKKLAEIKGSKYYKWFVFAMDFFLSIKLPVVKKVVEKKKEE